MEKFTIEEKMEIVMESFKSNNIAELRSNTINNFPKIIAFNRIIYSMPMKSMKLRLWKTHLSRIVHELLPKAILLILK